MSSLSRKPVVGQFELADELAERLKKHGFNENGASIANKLSRGTFSATFFLAALTGILAQPPQ